MYRAPGPEGSVAHVGRPSQRRIWLGALLTVLVSLVAGAGFAATHIVVLFIVLFPLTFFLIIGWLGLGVSAVGYAIVGAVGRKEWAPFAISGVATALLGGVCACAAAMTTTAIYTMNMEPPQNGGWDGGHPPTFVVACFHNHVTWADGAMGLMLGTAIGAAFGVVAMSLARERRSAV
jgi:hypothetical protein